MSEFPVEIWLKILENLVPEDGNLPIIGGNATWTSPASVYTRTWKLKHNKVDSSTPTECRYKDLLALRLTNRLFDELCTPYAFQEFNQVDPDISVVPDFSTAVKYAKHIRHMRILIGPLCGTSEVDSTADLANLYQAGVISLLAACQNLQSLALYFYRPAMSFLPFTDATHTLSHLSSLKSFGIYNLRKLDRDTTYYWDSGSSVPYPLQFLDAIASSPTTASKVIHLDFVMEGIGQEAYDKIRSRFPSLQSLTFRDTLHNESWTIRHVGQLWAPAQRDGWKPYANLTTLRFLESRSAYAPHIPELVRHFTALRHLLVTTCGGYYDEVSPPRTRGWSSESDALCKVHSPLDTFHIEHMLDWEIGAMATIPTKRLVVTWLRPGHLTRVFQSDPEVFPGLEEIQVSDEKRRDGNSEEEWGEAPTHVEQMKTIQAQRKLRVTHGAKSIMFF